MKILNSLAVLLMALMIISCGDKEISEDIMDTWIVESDVYTNCDNEAENETLTYSSSACEVTNEGCEFITVTFAAGTYTTVYTAVDGGELETDTDSGTYTVVGDSLTLAGTTFGVSIDGDEMIISGTSFGCDVTNTLSRQ